LQHFLPVSHLEQSLSHLPSLHFSLHSSVHLAQHSFLSHFLPHLPSCAFKVAADNDAASINRNIFFMYLI
jgi:hypothetical protein